LQATFLSASLSALSSSLTSNGNSTFNTNIPPFPLLSIPYRTHQALQIARLCQENADSICEALFLDLGKPREEVLLAEVGAVIERAVITAEKVEEWVTGGEAEKVEMSATWQQNWRAKVEKRAKGVGLVIS
jgi:aldehyde dehydrogenase (NAD+)